MIIQQIHIQPIWVLIQKGYVKKATYVNLR